METSELDPNSSQSPATLGVGMVGSEREGKGQGSLTSSAVPERKAKLDSDAIPKILKLMRSSMDASTTDHKCVIEDLRHHLNQFGITLRDEILASLPSSTLLSLKGKVNEKAAAAAVAAAVGAGNSVAQPLTSQSSKLIGGEENSAVIKVTKSSSSTSHSSGLQSHDVQSEVGTKASQQDQAILGSSIQSGTTAASTLQLKTSSCGATTSQQSHSTDASKSGDITSLQSVVDISELCDASTLQISSEPQQSTQTGSQASNILPAQDGIEEDEHKAKQSGSDQLPLSNETATGNVISVVESAQPASNSLKPADTPQTPDVAKQLTLSKPVIIDSLRDDISVTIKWDFPSSLVSHVTKYTLVYANVPTNGDLETCLEWRPIGSVVPLPLPMIAKLSNTHASGKKCHFAINGCYFAVRALFDGGSSSKMSDPAFV